MPNGLIEVFFSFITIIILIKFISLCTFYIVTLCQGRETL